MLKKDKSTAIDAPKSVTGGSATNSKNLPKSHGNSLNVSPSLPGAKPLPSGTTKTFSDSADDKKISFKPEIVDKPTRHSF